MKKYNILKNARELIALRPTKYEVSVFLITLLVGLYFYQYHQEAEAILGYASLIIVLIISHILGWFIMFCVHAFICYKRKVNFYGKPKAMDDDNESNNI